MTYERKKPSGAIIRFEIVKSVEDPTALGSSCEGLVVPRKTTEAAWAIDKNKHIDMK